MNRIIKISILIYILFPMILFANKAALSISIPDYINALDCCNIQNVQEFKSEKEVTDFVLCDDYIKESLLRFQSNAQYKSWAVETTKESQGAAWTFEIRSRGIIPSAYCIAKIDASSEIVFKECQYNK